MGNRLEQTLEEVAKEKELKKRRVRREEKRLKKVYENIQKDKAIIDGLIQRAAYMRITLEDFEKDIDTLGYVELFSQSDRMDPYERERPVARLYNTMNKNYQSIVKQLSDLVPKHEAKVEDDGFESFIGGRDD